MTKTPYNVEILNKFSHCMVFLCIDEQRMN